MSVDALELDWPSNAKARKGPGGSAAGAAAATRPRVLPNKEKRRIFQALCDAERERGGGGDVLTAENFPVLATRNSDWSRVGLPAECRRFHKHAHSFDCAHFGSHAKSGTH